MMSPSARARAVGAYVAVASLVLALVFIVLRLWRADLEIPLQSGGDTTFQQALIKAIGQNGWYSPNLSLGMPDGADLRDFPMPENLYFAGLKCLSLFVHNPVIVYNLFFLLTFPLIAVSATAVCRRFGLSFVVSGLVGVLFALLPYHFFRGQGHLMLSAYFLIPPIILVSWWVTMEDGVFFPAVGVARASPRWRTRRAVGACLVCLLAASTGVYYAAFSAFLLLVAGGCAAWARRRLYPAVAAVVLTSILTVGLLVNMLPSLVYMARHGHNVEATLRVPAEAEIYGLKIAQVILPIPHHRAPMLRQLMDRYFAGPLNNENGGAALGFVGAGGFLLLLAGLFRSHGADRPDSLRDLLPRLNIAAVLLGTIGGIGSLVALLVTPMIRSYNRISVFIAFFALLQVGMLLEGLREKAFQNGSKRVVFVALLAVLGAVAVLDQTSESFVPPYAALKAQYQRDDDFIRRVEAALPSSSMVFQLPYLRFPEDRAFQLESYAHLVPYLHARSLRWTFGAMRGRATDLWQRDVAQLPVDEFLESVAVAGFSAIYLDRAGYEDRGVAMEQRLGDLLQVQPLVNADHTIIVFPIFEWARRTREGMSDQAWADKREAVMHPVVLSTWRPGFSDLEVLGSKTWRWCSQSGTLALVNLSDRPKDVKIEMIVSTGYTGPSRFTVQIASEIESFQVNWAGSPYSKRFTLPPGATEIGFASDAPAVVAKGDQRVLVFRVDAFRKYVY